MKKAVLIVVVMLIPAMTLAENPDSRPSITIDLAGQLAALNLKRGWISRNGNSGDIAFGGLLKFPVNENTTLNFRLGFGGGRSYLDRNKVDYMAFLFHFGVTFYIGDSINK